jgi:2-dehydro-3-deoxyphosphogluconate aldolase/(4S)-4-hydroxy-2-oxoglutarate aldolase
MSALKGDHLTREEIRKQIRDIGLIPAVRVDSVDSAVFAAEHVLAGGIPIVEIAATIPDADRAIREISRRFPRMIVGAEVLASFDEAQGHLDAGAMFLTGPGFDPEMTRYCVQREIVVIPGALTPSEIMLADKLGADFVKVFPCADVGGPAYIRALRAPLPHVPLIAAGGVTQSTAPQYIAAGAIAVGVGEDMIPHRAVRSRQGDWIRELAARFLAFVVKARVEMQ